MELNSPRQDPYSTYSHTIEKLRKKGYKDLYEVMDENTLKDQSNHFYKADELVLNEIHRLLHKENDSEKTVIYALSADNGSMGILIDKYGENSSEVIDDFLQKVDMHDDLHKNQIE